MPRRRLFDGGKKVLQAACAAAPAENTIERNDGLLRDVSRGFFAAFGRVASSIGVTNI